MTKQMWLEKRAYESGTDFTAENTVQMSLDDAQQDEASLFDDVVIDNQSDD